MLNEEEGGPAFPVTEDAYPCPGMTLRDWFAGQALAGICASSDNFDMWRRAAKMAYTIADNMLSARNQNNGK